MKNILSNSDTRALTIATYLLKHQGATLRELQLEFDYSLNTLYKDIYFLNRILSPVSIQTSSDKKLYYIFPPNYSERHLYSCFLRESREINCLETIFFNSGLSMDELADKLFISLPTLKRIISRLNKILKEENIFIKKQPLRFFGEEKKIRSFFVTLFSEKYIYGIFPFKEKQLNTIDALYELFAPKFNQNINYPELQNLRLWISVSIQRTRQGYLTQTVAKDPNLDNIFLTLSHNNDFLTKVETDFSLRLTKLNVYSIFNIFTQHNFYIDYENLEIREKSKKKSTPLLKYEHLLSLIQKKFSLQLPEETKREILLTMTNTEKLVKFDTNILYPKEEQFYKNFKLQYASFSEFVLLHLKKMHSTSEISTLSYIEFYILVTHWENLIPQLQQLLPLTKILLFFDTDNEHLHMLKNILLSKYTSALEIHISKSLNLLELNEEVLDFDLVISNIPGDMILHPNHICISVFPTPLEWKYLDAKLR